MVDRLTPERRSRLMSKVRSRDTKPELLVRSLVHRHGYRFRLHRRDLPGSPDLVFSSRRAIIFVHGCFWHRHPGCRKATVPGTRREFWRKKFARNVKRDKIVRETLEQDGWRVLTVWECETRDVEKLGRRITYFLRRTDSGWKRRLAIFRRQK